MKTTQLYDRTWSRMGHHPLHECCDCGLVHTVRYKLVKGVLFEMWTVHKAETRKARKRKGSNARAKV